MRTGRGVTTRKQPLFVHLPQPLNACLFGIYPDISLHKYHERRIRQSRSNWPTWTDFQRLVAFIIFTEGMYLMILFLPTIIDTGDTEYSSPYRYIPEWQTSKQKLTLIINYVPDESNGM